MERRMNGWMRMSAVLLLLFLAGNAHAGCIGVVTGTDYGCGDTVIESCIFNEDMICQEQYGLAIGADGITVDGAGHSITINEHGDDGEGIHNDGCDRVMIMNLTISGFCSGIYFKDAKNGEIRDNIIDYTQGSGIWLFSSTHTNITGNTVGYGDGGHGILLSNAANGNMLGYNSITTVNGMGVNIDNSSENILHGNTVCNNRRGDIVVESGTGNTGSDNSCAIAQGYNDSNLDSDSSGGGCPCTHPCPASGTQSSDGVLDETERGSPTCGCVALSDPGMIFACGDIVTESYTFNYDLNCMSGHGLVIGADGVVIDGNGYTLDGVISGDCTDSETERAGIFNSGHDDLVIKDLEIKNFCNGIHLRGNDIKGDIVKNNTIDYCNVHHNGNDIDDTTTHGIKMQYVYESTISNNLVHHNKGRGTSCENGGNGIFIYGGEYNTLSNNTVYGNTKAGIYTKMKPKYNNITGNRVTENGAGGIVLRCKLSSFFAIENNIVNNNKGPGIYVGGPGNTLRYNNASENKEGSTYNDDASVANGIRISTEAHDTTLVGNTVTGNDAEDVYVKKGLSEIAGSNNTYETASNYADTSEKGEMVRGKKVAGKVKTIKRFDSGIEIPSIKATPMMATLIVVGLLVFTIFGYSRRK
ncbi:MAG: right-handed parallel beta-helix repeat-containing protein [Euryarchaeota archaeon]|nr:right-handed parallel beta-helix repeat-containing protein [Euryarchaeota archaeon]